MISYVCLKCDLRTSRAARTEGAEESGGAAEQHCQVLEGRRWPLGLLVQPFVQTFG